MRNRVLRYRFAGAVALGGAMLFAAPAITQDLNSLTVSQLMQELIVPTTTALWGAYEVQTDTQWQELESAATRLIAAGELLRSGGATATDRAIATNEDWQEFSNQMLAASRNALEAIRSRNEEALSSVGNDELYPPCESCHAVYMQQ